MYIIELIIKFLNRRNERKSKVSYYTEVDENQSYEIEECEHIFRPIDSTGMTLACIKCGFVVNMNDNQKEDIL